MIRAFATTAARYAQNNRAFVSGGFQGIRAFSDSFSNEGAAVGSKLKGACKWFDGKKGFGFIVPEDGSPDVFVHQSAIHAKGYRSLMDGEPVEYELAEQSDGKRVALDVTGPYGSFVQGTRNNFEGRRPRYNDYDRQDGSYDQHYESKPKY